MGRLLSVNVGLPRDVTWQGRTVHTGIWKAPVKGPRMVRRLNIDGDGQGDLAGHGGERRAVFVYQMDSYRYWQKHLGRSDFAYGQFGENFTVDGLSDTEVCIGDRYRIGGALFEVTQPRVTCYRLGIRMNEPEMAALVVKHGRPGFYFRVLEEGEVEAGDEITRVASGPERMSVSEIDALLYMPGHSRDELERALQIPTLSAGWRRSLEALLTQERKGGVTTGNAGTQSGVRPAPGVAWIPPASRLVQGPREPQRDFAAARADGRTTRRCGSPRAVPCAAARAAICACADAQLFAVGGAWRRVLSRQRQAGSPWRGQRLRRRRTSGWRHRAGKRGTGQFHTTAGRYTGCVVECGDRRDASARNASRAGRRSIDEGNLVAIRHP